MTFTEEIPWFSMFYDLKCPTSTQSKKYLLVTDDVQLLLKINWLEFATLFKGQHAIASADPRLSLKRIRSSFRQNSENKNLQSNSNMRTVVLLLLGVHLAWAGTHSMKYFYTGVSGNINFPEFTVVGLLDDDQFVYFDSNTMKAVPKTEWIRQNEGAEYWDGQTQIFAGAHPVFKNNIQVAKERFNQSTGVHSLQWMYGCELDTDGTKRGYMQFGFDGEDFLSLDKSSLTWTAANPQAVMTKVKWDSTGAEAKQQKGYLENTCIEWLQKYVGYGKDTLERKVSPQVSLLQKDPSSPVTCHTTGFYPSGVTITWQKNGQDHDEDVDLGELITNEDGTFQRASTLNVKPDEWKNNKFSCVVEHQDKTIREILTEDKIKTNYAPFPIGIIIGVVVAVLLLLIVIGVVGYKVYQKKKGFKPVNASDDGSNSSAHTDPKA